MSANGANGLVPRRSGTSSGDSSAVRRAVGGKMGTGNLSCDVGRRATPPGLQLVDDDGYSITAWWGTGSGGCLIYCRIGNYDYCHARCIDWDALAMHISSGRTLHSKCLARSGSVSLQFGLHGTHCWDLAWLEPHHSGSYFGLMSCSD